jgi:hypothetical protein
MVAASVAVRAGSARLLKIWRLIWACIKRRFLRVTRRMTTEFDDDLDDYVGCT